MAKVPDYTKAAINRYNAKFDRIAVNLPKGTKERIKGATGQSCNAYISGLVLDDLQRLESGNGENPHQNAHDAPEQPETTTAEQIPISKPETPKRANKKPKMSIEELNELVKAKQAEAERIKAESERQRRRSTGEQDTETDTLPFPELETKD